MKNMRPLIFKILKAYFEASTEILRNSFISLLNSRAALRARVPAALFYLSVSVTYEYFVLGIDFFD